VKEVLDILLEVREELRRRRIYDISDRIRDRLAEIGIIVEDTAQGQRIRFRPR
jgi:cysteinyl-tRNA synthetase (EC 6.1.1.16)